MKEIILDNNLKLIYKHSESELTSILMLFIMVHY